MLDADTHGPPHAVTAALRAAGCPADGTSWAPLSGGRCNRLWTFRSTARDLVLKLYSPTAATPLFPNDPRAEALALSALAGTGLAPRLHLPFTCAAGEAIVYDFLHPAGDACAEEIAAALARLHRQPAPPGLRTAPAAPAAILADAEAMLADVPDAEANPLRHLRPDLPEIPAGETVFLHGDPVPANAVRTARGVSLIDWQCPALGDPVHDLAIFLSPAMQRLYGNRPMDPDRAEAFLAAYGHPARAARFRALAPLHHYRMAAHCLWKAASGDADYAAAAGLEIACLERAR